MRHTHTANVYPTTGQINIPVAVVETQQIGYNDEVRVTLPNLGDGDTIVGFERYADSTLKLTIPAEIRRKFDLPEESIAVEMTATGEKWEPDEPTKTRGGNRTEVKTLR